jgi:hypothetical protein
LMLYGPRTVPALNYLETQCHLFVSILFLDIYDLMTEVLELNEDFTTNCLRLEIFL